MGSVPVPQVEAVSAWEAVGSGKGLILDVRESEELQQVSISEAVHLPLGSLQNRSDEIPRDRDVYVICHVGQRSAMATEFLRSLGHERVWNVRGGIIAWLRAGLPADWETSP